jgi:hypothetical protein
MLTQLRFIHNSHYGHKADLTNVRGASDVPDFKLGQVLKTVGRLGSLQASFQWSEGISPNSILRPNFAVFESPLQRTGAKYVGDIVFWLQQAEFACEECGITLTSSQIRFSRAWCLVLRAKVSSKEFWHGYRHWT